MAGWINYIISVVM